MASLLALWHTAASFVWIAPDSGAREIFPNESLRSYMIPLFGQDWSVFAPNPVNGDYELRVRAVLEDPATEARTTTEWVSITQAELTQVKHRPFPSRAGIVSWTAASEYKRAYDSLESKQRDTVALSFYKGDDWQRRLGSSVRRAGVAPATERFLLADQRLTGFASMTSQALWGNDVDAVQFQARRINVVPFDDRLKDNQKRPNPKAVDSGWRGVIEFPESSVSRFSDTLVPLVERTGQKF